MRKPLSIGTRTFSLFFVITCGLICVSVSNELETDIKEHLAPLRTHRLNLEERKAYADKLFSLRECESRLGGTMARLAIASRYNGALDDRTWTIQPIFKKIHAGNYTAEELEQYREFDRWREAESKIVNRATTARTDLQWIIEALGEAADERVVPFLCPLLAERGQVIDKFSDGPTGTPQERSAHALRVSTFRGLTLHGAPDGYVIEDWRRWWRQNRHRYPPPPPVLAELEATEGGTRPLPPVTTPPAPPATPTPKAAAPASTPEPATLPLAKPAAEEASPRISLLWLIALPVILLLFALLARRRTF